MSAAKDVTDKDDAEHLPQAGAAFADAIAQRRAKSAAAFVIEADPEDEEISPSKSWLLDNERTLVDGDAFDIIKRARKMLIDDEHDRATRRDTPPGPSTRDTYLRKCGLIDNSMAAIQDPWAPPLQQAMCKYAPHKRSFFVMRAALKWRAIGRVRSQLRAVDDMQRSGVRDNDWRRQVQALNGMATDLHQVLDLDLAECLDLSEREAVASDSKKYTLRLLKPGWRNVFLAANASSATYKRAGVLMRYCGLRPKELEQGVVAALIGDQVRVQISGAKVRDTAGQPWRQFSLRADMLPAWFTAELKSGSQTYTADRDNMRQHLVRISATLYPRKYEDGKPDIILSAYVFRHALATDLRGAGWSFDDIAAVLGESSAETARWYGLWPKRGSRHVEPSAIVPASMETCRPVRPLSPPDPVWIEAGRPSGGTPQSKARSPGRGP